MKKTLCLLLALLCILMSSCKLTLPNDQTSDNEDAIEIIYDPTPPIHDNDAHAENISIRSSPNILLNNTEKKFPQSLLTSLTEALAKVKVTDQIESKLSDLPFSGNMTELDPSIQVLWLEIQGKIYRIAPPYETVCLVDTHYGEGRILESSEDLMDVIFNAASYTPNNFWKGTCENGVLHLQHISTAKSTIQLTVKELFLRSSKETSQDIRSMIKIELLSEIDQTVTPYLQSKSGCVVNGGNREEIELEAGVPKTLDLPFDGGLWWTLTLSVGNNYMTIDFK